MIQSADLNNGVDLVTVPDCSSQRFQEKSPNAFARHIAGTALTERPATAIRSRETAIAQQKVLFRMNGRVDSTGDSKFTLTASQTFAGQMNRGQRRRTHGIERQTRTVPIEKVRNPVGDRRKRRT